MPNKNLGQIVTAAWDEYVGSSVADETFSSQWLIDELAGPESRTPQFIVDLTGERKVDSEIRLPTYGHLKRAAESFWRPTQHAPNVMITSPYTFSKYQELLTGLGKVSQKRLNANLFSDGSILDNRITPANRPRLEVGITPEQKIQLELSESLEKMLTI